VICTPSDHYIPVTLTFEWRCPSCGTSMMVKGEAWELGECPAGAIVANPVSGGPP
jgi:hypothetical protein